MSTDKRFRSVNGYQTPPKQPDYSDEISVEQLDAIRKLADPQGKHAANRVLLYPDAW